MIESEKNPVPLVKSPCVRNCCLNDEDNCLGCFRSLDEIIHWAESDDTVRKSILEKCEQRRMAYVSKWHK